MKGLDYFYDVIHMYDIKSYKTTSINLLWFDKDRPVNACANTVICTKYSYTFIMLPILRKSLIFMPPFEKGGHIALHMSVGMSVSLNLVQLITQECFAQEASNLVGR